MTCRCLRQVNYLKAFWLILRSGSLWVHMIQETHLEEVFAVGGLKAKSLELGRKFWAFKPIKLPSLPDVQKHEWIKDEIDRFILRRLENKKYNLRLRLLFDFAPQTFDLTGLPPSRRI